MDDMPSTRIPYKNQTCHSLLVDSATVPLHALQNFCQSLLRVVCLCVSTHDSTSNARITALSLRTLKSDSMGAAGDSGYMLNQLPGFAMACPLGRVDELRKCTVQLLQSASIGGGFYQAVTKQCISEVLSTIIHEYDSFCSLTQSIDGRQMDMTVLTSDDDLVKQLHEWTSEQDTSVTDKIRRIQVYVVDTELHEKNDTNDHDTKWRPYQIADNTCDNVTRVNNTPQSRSYSNLVYSSKCLGQIHDFTAHFQCWLVEEPGDTEHVRLILPVPPSSNMPMVLKFDLRPLLVSPSLLPFGQQLSITDTSRPNQHSSTRTTQVHERSVCALEAVYRVSHGQVCQSVIHGEPALLTPTNSWLLHWNSLQYNKQCVLALSDELSSSQECLICRLRNEAPLSPMFVLLAVEQNSVSEGGGGGGLLLLSLTPAELMLPSDDRFDKRQVTSIPHQVRRQVVEVLSTVNYQPTLSPCHFTCGIHHTLNSLLSTSNSRNQKRDTGYAGRKSRADNTPSAGGRKTAVTAVRTRGATRGARGRSLYWNDEWGASSIN